MPDSSGATTPLWLATTAVPQFPALAENAQADVCVVGAGIAGLSVAYTLQRAGKSVLVLEDGDVGSGETGRTTAHLSNALDDRYTRLERLHGKKGAQLAASSHTAAINRIELITREENLACDFEFLDGYLFVPPGESTKVLEDELQAAERAGLAGLVMVPRAPLEGFDTGPCLRFPRQAQFHPLKYLAGLARAVQQGGGRIFTHTHVSQVEGGSPARVWTSTGHTVRAAAVAVATNTPVNDRFAVHTKQAPYRSYVIGARVPAGAVTKALYWDTLDPYHYIRLQGGAGGAGQDVLIVGGEDHKTGQAEDTEERFRRLEAWARERFPRMTQVEYRWSGQVLEPVDSLAFIGRNPGDENVYIATGDSGHGMTHGTIAGILLTDLILGRDNPWAPLYDPARVRLRAAGTFAQENLNVAAQYADWATGGDVSSVNDIAPGTGAVLRSGLHKLAVYRDEQGVLHERSAVCPHLGCIVNWNATERTWDCPCHGSRFDPYGQVLNGPANENLPHRELVPQPVGEQEGR
jgi:glycine/D-amino acid oxidase-like deaminating enzyme/nitrite reductase/ring-hydroxylating ferredoxin subunit